MKQTVEEAAREFSDYNGCMPNAPHSIIKQSHQRAFIKGAEWQAKQSAWISVKERLPEFGENVFQVHKYKGIVIISFMTFLPRNLHDEKGWCFGDDKVLAWMPVPSFDGLPRSVRRRIGEI